MADYYIATADNGGSNSNTGTLASPWLTLDFALSYISLAPGDTIHLGAGTFATAASSDISGTNGNPITIEGAGVELTIHTGKLTLDKDYYVIRNIKFSDNILQIGGSTPSNEGSYNIIEYCDFTNSAQGINIYYLGRSQDGTVGQHDNLIRHCNFYSPVGNGMLNIGGYDNIAEYCHFYLNRGFDAVHGAGLRNTVRYCLFTEINNPVVNSVLSLTCSGGVATVVTATPFVDIDDGNGIIIAGATPSDYNTGSSGRFCTVINSTTLTYIPLIDPGDGTATGTITLQNVNHADTVQIAGGGGYLHQNFYFYGNTRIGCTGQYGNLEGEATNTEVQTYNFWNNIHINSLFLMNCFIPNCTLYNETIYSDSPQSSTLGFRFVGGVPSRGVANNGRVYNIIALRWNSGGNTTAPWGFEGGTTGGLAGYNLVSNATDGAISGLTNPNGINGGYTPSQVFVNPTGGANLHLLLGSPAIASGDDLSASFTTDASGATRTVPWDMGGYAYVIYRLTRMGRFPRFSVYHAF